LNYSLSFKFCLLTYLQIHYSHSCFSAFLSRTDFMVIFSVMYLSDLIYFNNPHSAFLPWVKRCLIKSQEDVRYNFWNIMISNFPSGSQSWSSLLRSLQWLLPIFPFLLKPPFSPLVRTLSVVNITSNFL
jgi:hypothetical protein